MAKTKFELKPLFEERMKKLLGNEEDFGEFKKIIYVSPRNFIRCNTLKISVRNLAERLGKKWKIAQPFKERPEIMLVENDLAPGELGSAIEHILGYYYVQEISSMLPALALDLQPGEFVLDLCSSPGSKTTQIASMMDGKGTIVANEIDLGRMKILSSNLERCGVSNAIVTRNDGFSLCERIAKTELRFDKILLDAPCSGEGTLRSSQKAFLQWNVKVVSSFSRQQKKMLASAIKCLKVGGTIVYSTCTHSPEEDEEVVDFALNNFPVKIEKVNLPLKSRPGITSWEGKNYSEEVKNACRIYPQDNNSEGFFLSKMTLLNEVKE